MESGAEQQPLYTVLPEKLIQPPTISSKEDSFRSVTYSKNDNAFYPSSGSVLSVRRLPPAKKKRKKQEWNLATLDLHYGSSTTELQGTLIGLNDNPSTYCYEF